MTMTVMSLIRQAIRRFLVGEEAIAGAALIEFTIFAPMLVIMSTYTMDFGFLLYRQMQVQNAAQAGVDWAIANHVFNAADITAAVNNATNYANITVSTGYPIEQCGCPSSTGVTFTSNTAPAPCPLCGTLVGGLYVTVQTQATWNSFIPYGLFSSTTAGTPCAPPVVVGRCLTAQVTARIQ
jgi:Flp pilus assembly protein TadG